MNFNPRAFINPTSNADYAQLLDEALRMVDELGEQWDQAFDVIKGEEKMTTETRLTDAEIITIGHQARAIETGENGYILPVTFARAIEQAVLQSLEVGAMRRDTERINFIDEAYGVDIVCFDVGGWEVSGVDTNATGETLREALDAAMKEQS